ncbi:DUF5596 domain-containing protein [Streptomyces sp. NA04227]|uniref:acyltransferase domain-containing protein n=1 Tax=Streptomyces sp. NA04227 TaxID=2742136 RepID=UPI0015924266|nr:acyltransferase domain-containing protein [Streptomyces sp. NA04227]QKW09914.1 DUF5596 domain-containing protein [Streptomyces sp. NA04227]
MQLDATAVAARLGMREHLGWFMALEDTGPPAEPVVLPTAEEAYALLEDLEVPERDRDAIVDSLPVLAEDPVLRWILERAHQTLLTTMGHQGGQTALHALPYEHSDAARYFYVHLFLVTLPATRRFHAAHGIPEEITRHTMTQLGEMVAIHRRKFGAGGMNTQTWLSLHLRGVIHRLGRLQFELMRWRDEPVLNVHIPATGGPMTPEACDDSFRRARPFFAAHFPEHGAERALCHSWLLDPQLAEYLPEDSNVVRFMRRWERVDEEPRDGDESVLEFVFRRNGQPLDQLPQRTSLERAAVTHLRAGRHWHAPHGLLRLP